MDLLSHFLLMLKVESTSISSWQMSSPWGVNVRDYEPGFCFMVEHGTCWIDSLTGGTVQLGEGDTLLVPRGGACKLMSTPGADLTDLHDLNWSDDRPATLDRSYQPGSAISVVHGGGGTVCRLLGLAFTIESGQGEFVLSQIPQFVVLRKEDASTLAMTRAAVHSLVLDSKPGYFAVAKHMAELIVIGLLRAYILTDQSFTPGWLKGLRDTYITKSMLAMHEQPEKQWTVPQLASAANLSRSAFAARFSKLVGMSPIDYLHNWRITLAQEMLKNSKRSITAIASSLGYQSDRVFRQAFKQRLNLSPREYRAKFTVAEV
jgi:AraC-like DNA-binding protein